MTKKKRGGRRKGSGRKPKLSSEVRLLIGGRVHTCLAKVTQEAFDRSLDARAPLLKDHYNRVDQFPAASRRQWRELEERYGDDASDAAPNLAAIGEIRDDINSEIETGPLKGKRWEVGPQRTAYGTRRKVLLEVARAMSCRYGIAISTRMAERCLEEFRAFEKLISKALI